jgi:hypothetical protein
MMMMIHLCERIRAALLDMQDHAPTWLVTSKATTSASDSDLQHAFTPDHAHNKFKPT